MKQKNVFNLTIGLFLILIGAILILVKSVDVYLDYRDGVFGWLSLNVSRVIAGISFSFLGLSYLIKSIEPVTPKKEKLILWLELAFYLLISVSFVMDVIIRGEVFYYIMASLIVLYLPICVVIIYKLYKKY